MAELVIVVLKHVALDPAEGPAENIYSCTQLEDECLLKTVYRKHLEEMNEHLFPNIAHARVTLAGELILLVVSATLYAQTEVQPKKEQYF